MMMIHYVQMSFAVFGWADVHNTMGGGAAAMVEQHPLWVAFQTGLTTVFDNPHLLYLNDNFWWSVDLQIITKVG